MNKFSLDNLKQVLGLVKTLVETAVSNVTTAYTNLVGEIGKDKDGNNHTVKSYVDAKVADIHGAAESLEGRVAGNESAIETINGDVNTEGSFKKYFNDMWATLTNADGGTIDKLQEVLNWFKGVNVPGSEDNAGATLIADVAANKSAVGTKGSGETASTGLYLYAEQQASAAQGNAKAEIDAINEKIGGSFSKDATVAAAIASAQENAEATAAADATSKANTAEQNAKDYTDQQIEAIAAYTEDEILGAWNAVFNPGEAA